MCSAHPAAQGTQAGIATTKLAEGFLTPGLVAEGSPTMGQELENQLSSFGLGQRGPNQGLHHDLLRPGDPRLSVSGNGTPSVSSGSVLKA